jgi:hypothetical protein
MLGVNNIHNTFDDQAREEIEFGDEQVAMNESCLHTAT